MVNMYRKPFQKHVYIGCVYTALLTVSVNCDCREEKHGVTWRVFITMQNLISRYFVRVPSAVCMIDWTNVLVASYWVNLGQETTNCKSD